MEEETARQERERRDLEQQEGKTQLESVPEEGKQGEGESQPLLDQSGEPSGSGSGSGSRGAEDGQGDKKDDEDKMDTA